MRQYLLLCLSFVLVFSACKDDDPGNPVVSQSGCDLKTQFIPNQNPNFPDTTTVQTFSFDGVGRPTSANLKSFSYPESNVVEVLSANGTIKTRYSLGSNGFPESAWTFPAPGTTVDTSYHSFSYDGQDHMIQQKMSKGLRIGNESKPITVNYSWENGNLDNWECLIDGQGTPLFSYNYDYDGTELKYAYNYGFLDLREGVLDFIPGLAIYGTPPQDIPVGRSDGTSIKTYDFELDADGLVSHWWSLSNGVTEQEKWFDYTCN